MAFTLKIITPANLVFEGTTEELNAPGLDGLFGILSGHAPMVAGLTEGNLLFKADGQEKSIAISGGFLEVSNNVVTVLADSADV